MTKKTRLVSCRLSESDYAFLCEHAGKLELCQSDYLRYLIRIPVDNDGLAVEGRCVTIDTLTLGRIYAELVRWGRHYNQAVRAMNTIALNMRHGRYDQPFFNELMESANSKLERTESGRAGLFDELKRLERCTLIGS